MKTCPSCNAKLTDEELQAGHCEVCDSDFEPQPLTPQAGPPAASQNYMQTVDGSALPIDLDSDSLDFDSLPEIDQEPAGNRNYMQTVDSSVLPIDLDSDAFDIDSSPEIDEDKRSKQTIAAVDLAATIDSDSVDIPTVAPGAPVARAFTQTIEAVELPESDDSDSIDMDMAPPTNEKAYTQTIDSATVPIEADTDSFDADSLLNAASPTPSNYNQTIDASQLPANGDSDSVDFSQGVAAPKDVGIGGTVDSLNVNFDQDSDSIDGPQDPMGNNDATIDSASLPAAGVKPGTVSEIRGMQTVDADAGSVVAPEDGTVNERKYMATVDSADIVGDDPGTLPERQHAQTYDSSVVADDPKAMNDLWDGDQNAGATPRMTIKGRETPPRSSNQSLVVQRRAFREVSAEQAFGGSADYDLVKKLGEGGMGVVYAGRQASIDRTVAIKMLKPHMAADQGQRNKFLAEAVITGDLDHPNIVPIYDLGANDEGALFYAMKCVKGTPWDDCIGKKSLSENIEILLKACDAVAFGHSRGIIHRDLKPENTMLGGFGEVLVMDWGLALPFGKFEKSRSITQSASMGGTPAYMAPEMATGPFDKMGPASDIYLLGAILYEIVTSNPPHRGKDVMKCLFAAAKNQIVPTEKKGELVDIALKAMATNIEDRYATVQDFQAAIRGYLDHSESISMSVRATDDLQAAQNSDRYEDFSRAVFGFEEAYALWDGNSRALEGVMLAKLAYATSALKKGDFDLGTSLLDRNTPEHAQLANEIDEAKHEREARHHRAQQLKRVVVGMAAVGFISAIVVSTIMYSLKTEADNQRLIADAAADEAKRQEGIAKDERAVAVQQTEIAKMERAEALRQEEIAKMARDEAVRQEEIATMQREIAVKQEAIAKDERDNARIAQAEAVRQEGIAKDEKNKAEYEAYVALIGLAAAKIDENAFGRARELLENCKPVELRNWEWGRLMYICSQSVHDYDVGAPVDAIAFAPDGKRFVTGGWNGTARVWSVEDGSYVELPHEGLYVQSVAFSPNANQVATGCDDKSAYLRIWDLETRQPLHTLRGHEDAVTSISYSRDGKRLLTTSFDNTARIWNVETGEQLQILEGHSWWVWDAAFSPDESQVVTVSQDGTAIVWTLADGAKSPAFAGHQGPVYSVAFSPDGEHIVSGGYDKRVLLWTAEDLQPFDFNGLLSDQVVPPPKFYPLDGHTAPVRSVQFSADGKLVLSAGHDNTVKVWSVDSPAALKTLRGHDSWVRACAFSPDGQWVLSGGYDNHARLWNVEGYEEVRVLRGRVLEGHQDAIMAVSFSRDGHQIATASRDRTAKSWNADTGAELVSFREGHQFLASDSAFFSDNKQSVNQCGR